MTERLNYLDSFKRAQSSEALEGRPKPGIPTMPRHDDGEPGPSYFRTLVSDSDLSHLTLYGLFIGRSELRKVRFEGTDLRLSSFCWNDFFNCDFSKTDLSPSDLRASNFTSCTFRDADLEGCDLRHSTFEKGEFEGARMSGAILTREQQPRLKLSSEQRKSIRWELLSGPEPAGG